MVEGVPAVEYHERTKHTPQSVRAGAGLDFENQPRPAKLYDWLPTVELGSQVGEPATPTLAAVADRATDRSTDRATGRGAAEAAAESAVDLAAVATLCHHAAGITKTIRRRGREHEFRAPACTGALYHVDIYLACGDLAGTPAGGRGLDAGVYHYDPTAETLDVLREGDHRDVVAAAAGDPAIADAPIVAITTSTWWRNAWKYGARTYRHAFWDSGTLLANLLATATAIDLPARVLVGFADEPVADLLGVDPAWEAPLEVVPIGGRQDEDARGADRPPSPGFEPIDPPTVPDGSDPVEYPLIHEAWAASTLPDGAAAQAWRERGDRTIDGRGRGDDSRRSGDGERVALEPVDTATASSHPLHRTVVRRGSCREYERDDLDFRKISTVLDRALRGAPMAVRDPDGPPLQFVDAYCVVNGVEGVAPGTYQLHTAAGDGGELELLHAGECREAAGHLALDQPLGADAALCVYFMADLAAVTDALGDRGYRAAQLEAAIAGGRLYLATYAHRDLGGTGLTFYDDAVTAFFEPRAAGQTPMFLYTMGRPA